MNKVANGKSGSRSKDGPLASKILLNCSMKLNLLHQIIILLSVVLCFNACQKDEEENPDVSTIEYTLSAQEAGHLADIEYTSVFGMVMKLEDEALPWSTSFSAIFKIGDAISFKAESGVQGEMTAQIIVNDELVASKTASHFIQLNYIKGLK